MTIRPCKMNGPVRTGTTREGKGKCSPLKIDSAGAAVAAVVGIVYIVWASRR